MCQFQFNFEDVLRAVLVETFQAGMDHQVYPVELGSDGAARWADKKIAELLTPLGKEVMMDVLNIEHYVTISASKLKAMLREAHSIGTGGLEDEAAFEQWFDELNLFQDVRMSTWVGTFAVQLYHCTVYFEQQITMRGRPSINDVFEMKMAGCTRMAYPTENVFLISLVEL